MIVASCELNQAPICRVVVHIAQASAVWVPVIELHHLRKQAQIYSALLITQKIDLLNLQHLLFKRNCQDRRYLEKVQYLAHKNCCRPIM